MYSSAVVLRQRQQTLAAKALDHLVAQPAAEHVVAERAGLRVLLDDVEGFPEVVVVADRVEALETGVRGVLTLDVVVAQVVAENRDVGGPKVRLDHEDVVLQTPTALAEADALALQEFLAEHLVRREAGHERGAGDVGARMVHAEELHRHRTALAGHLADDDVGLVLDAVVVHALQRLVTQPVVVVHVHDELALGRGGADIAGLARPARGFLVDDVHVRVLGGDLVQPRRGGVGGAVVDEDGLVLVVRKALPKQ